MARHLLSDNSSDSEDGGAEVQSVDLKVNESFARRFEYNKKREELQRLSEIHGEASRKRKRTENSASDDDSSDESTSESEDEGDLATAALDSEIMATIKAIRSKDPRVYDQSVVFYTQNEETTPAESRTKKDKPMHLQDYHRQNLLNGGLAEEDEPTPLTYTEEQEQLKKSVVGEINAAAAAASGSEDEDRGKDEEDEFLVAKEQQSPSREQITLDVDNAEKDPEIFLSNFMVSRAWAAPDSKLHPFESDDEEEEQRAEEYEEAYNLRFEDPAKSNEKLRSHARDAAAKYSVRRDETNPRQKKREAEKARKEAEKQQRKEEKARLRKLKIEELEEKLKRIKKAAGFSTNDLQPEDWSRLVDDDWDDAQWEEEMQKRFGDEYYAQEEVGSDDEMAEKKKKVRKPKFDDDIDIKDIVPEFQDDDRAQFSLSDEESGEHKKKKGKKSKHDEKRDARKERRIIEQLVEDQLRLELESSVPQKAGFRYRETSPKSFGLTPRDILLADDKQLNEFAGLKKLAAFRDPEKKRKDARHLGKKARLRKWRLDTFGKEDGLEASELIPKESGEEDKLEAEDGNDDNIKEGTRKKKRRRNNKKNKVEVDETV
ncbi:Kinetochore protein Spc24 [Exophiala oligosperma]